MGPPWTQPVNDPPVVLLPVDTDNVLQLISDPTSVTVLARDPEWDQVYFEWDIPDEFVVEEISAPQEDHLHVSLLSLRRDARLDGFTLRCVVTDHINSTAEQLRWEIKLDP